MRKGEKKILAIYGAGGLGREVFELALIINSKECKWDDIIFIDDADKIKNPRKIKILNFSDIISESSNEIYEFCIAVGEPEIRKKLRKKISDHNLNLVTLIHPDILIPSSTVIGKGTIIFKYLSITCDISIGENVYIQPNVCIGHDAIIGDNSVISSYVDVAGDCTVGSNTYLAINVCMRQGVSIGNNTIVGMASVVHRDLPDNIIALGNPARAMKKNDERRVFK